METIETGPFFMRATCRACHGRRETIAKPCYECSGKGKTIQQKFTTIPIPAGKDLFKMKIFRNVLFFKVWKMDK
jgi:DnaJ-class molecular chaperone